MNAINNFNVIKSLLTIFILSYTVHASSQATISIKGDKHTAKLSLGIVTGLHGFKSYSSDFGIGVNFIDISSTNKNSIKPFAGFSFTIDKNFNNKEIIGQNLDIWFNSLIVIGINQNFHKLNDFETWGIKPYLGFEIWGITLTYGYNMFLNDNRINELFHHTVSLRRYFSIIIIKYKEK